MAYSSVQAISDYLGRDLTQDEQDYLAVLIPAIKKWLDLRLGTTFDEASATTRKYDGGYPSLDIDPCTAITSVDIIDSEGTSTYTYESTDYVAEPVNSTVKTELRKRYGKWPKGIANIQVSAKFSEYDGGVPEDIQIATTRIAASFLSSSSNVGNVESESIEGHSVTYTNESIDKMALEDPIVLSIINQRREIAV